MQTIITAGGRAARFNNINKSMLPINGIPIIEHLIKLSVENEITDIGIVVGETTYINIISHLRNGSRFGANITYFYQDHSEPNDIYGFPSALYLTKNWVKEDTIILCGDNFLKGVKLKKFIEEYQQIEGNSKILVGCKYLHKNEGRNYAVLDNSLVPKFVEKPGILNKICIDNFIVNDNEEVVVYAGPLVCNKIIFEYIEKLKPSGRGELEIVDLINMHKEVLPFYYDGIYFDIGSEVNYADAIRGTK